MRSLFRFGLVAAALSLFVAACGDSEEKKENLGDPRGGLRVAAKSLDSLAEVDSITVTLSDAVNTYVLDLAPDADDVWRAYEEDLFVGEYEVEAIAVDADDNVLFTAAPDQKVMIAKDKTTEVTIFLNEVRDSGKLELPRFVMVSLDKGVVEQFETLTITVEVEGGTAPYKISGVNALNPPDWNPSGSFSDADFSGNVGTIVWTPPKHAGPKWFKVEVEDAAGNKAELGVDVTVGADIGDIDLEVDFIMAPISEISGRILNDNEGTSVYLWVKTGGSGWTTSVNYTWDHAGCGGVFESGAESGVFAGAMPANGWYFKYQIERPVLPGQTTPAGTPAGDPAGIGICTITLRTEGDHGSTYDHDVVIDTKWVQPGV